MRKIKELRISKNISQSEIAKNILIERSTYNRIETGKTELTLRTLDKISKFLETDIQSLLDFNNTTINDVSNNTGNLAAHGINTTLNINIPPEAIEEIKKLFTNN